MKVRLVWLGVATFLVTLVTVLPVRWVSGLLPASVQCRAWAGSVWRGQCTDMNIQQYGTSVDVQDLRWILHPSALLRMTVKADFSIRTSQGTASGVAELGRDGRMAVENLAVNALFDRRLYTSLAEGWNAQLEARNLTLRMQGNTLQALSGEIGLHNFNDGKGNAFGSYRLVFPRSASAPYKGRLTDAGGPLEASAEVTIAEDRRWQLNALITPRPEAAQSLRSRLDILGAPDAAGRYTISSEGSFK